MKTVQREPRSTGFSDRSAARAKLDDYAARTGRRIRLEIDGGVKVDNIAEIARAGADTFVAGSAVFGPEDAAAAVEQLRALVRRHPH